jgi:hypothetical protein
MQFLRLRPAAAAFSRISIAARPPQLTRTTTSLFTQQLQHPLVSTSIRWSSAWVAAPRAKPFTCSVPGPYAGIAANDRALMPLMVYDAGQKRYMKGLGWVLLFAILPMTFVLTWPSIYKQYKTTEPNADSRDAVESDLSAAAPSPMPLVSHSSHLSALEPPSSRTMANYLLAMNALLVVAVAALARFNQRLIHTVYLYPQTRILSIQTLGPKFGFGTTPLQFVRLDAVIPPFSRTSNDTRLRVKIDVDQHPAVSPAEVKQGGAASLTSAAIAPARSYVIFPLPNIATGPKLGYLTREKNAIDEFWLRFLTTGVHTTKQMEELQVVQVERASR